MPDSAPQHPPAPTAAPVRLALLAVLAAPWVAHGLVTGLSALGVRPISARGPALAIIVVSALVPLAAVRIVGRWRRADYTSPRLGGAAGHLCAALSALAAVALGGAFLGALALPVIAYDALGYRLPVVADWLDAGRVAWVTTDDPVRNGYPLGQEAIGAVLAAVTGSTNAAVLASFFYIVAGALSIWVFAEQVGVRRELARAAAALFLLVPIVILNAPTGYVDASFAGAVVSFVLLSALAFSEESADLVLAAAAGMSAAHALSLKGTGVTTLLAVSLAVAAARVVKRRAGGAPLPRFGLRLGVAASFAAPGAFWLVRNLVHTGNPLWPVTIRIAGRDVLPGAASLASILDVAHNTPASFAGLSDVGRVARTWLETAGPAVAFDDRLAGLGLVWPLFALPAIAVTAFRLSKGSLPARQRTPIAIAFIATGIAFVLQPMHWWSRYTIWLWGAGALALAVTAESMIAAGRGRAVSVALSLVTGLAAVEGGIALLHANGLGTAVARAGADALFSGDARKPPNALEWVDATFWKSGVGDSEQVCRGAWKPGTDDAILDGVFAQLTPRPHVHVVADDDADWSRVEKAWNDAGCANLLLFRGSPVLPLAQRDPGVTVEPAVAFDPLFIVRARQSPRLAARNQVQ